MSTLANLNKVLSAINLVLIVVYLLVFQQVPLIGRFISRSAEALLGERLNVLEAVLLYSIGFLTVLSLVLIAFIIKGPVLRLTLLLFSVYIAHIFIGKISVAFYNKFFSPWGIPDPWATILLFATAVLFTLSMLLREASKEPPVAAEAA